VAGLNQIYRSCRGTLLITNTPLLGPYSGTIPRVILGSMGVGAASYQQGFPVKVPGAE